MRLVALGDSLSDTHADAEERRLRGGVQHWAFGVVLRTVVVAAVGLLGGGSEEMRDWRLILALGLVNVGRWPRHSSIFNYFSLLCGSGGEGRIWGCH